MSDHKNRLDVEMAKRGIVRSRSAAADLVQRGKVQVGGKAVTKPSFETTPEDVISIAAGVSFVSRAGEKLDHALTSFGINVKGLDVLDIGSSTGGFVDCLLSRGAKRVVAVDVGTDQLDPSLRSDPRVESIEGTDIRELSLPAAAEMATIDVSFISLAHVLPKAFELVRGGGTVVVLVKPQFEVGKEIADKFKGIISDDRIRAKALDDVLNTARKIGFVVENSTTSPIEGEKGNREFLVFLRKPTGSK